MSLCTSQHVVFAVWHPCPTPWCAFRPVATVAYTPLLSTFPESKCNLGLQAAAAQNQEDAGAATPSAAPEATPDQAAADATSHQVAQNGHRGTSGLQSNGSGGTGAKAFQRVKDDEWLGKRGSWSNSYADTFGEAGWGAKASATLQQVTPAHLCNGLCRFPLCMEVASGEAGCTSRRLLQQVSLAALDCVSGCTIDTPARQG